MKTIESIQKKKAGFEIKISDEILIIEPELKIKYHLNVGTELDLKTFNQLVDENDFAYFYRLSIVRLKKIQTRFELKEYMESKGAKQKIVRQVLDKLESRNYINDEDYIKTYLQLKSSSKGPKMIEFELRKKGVSPELIDRYLSVLDEHEAISHLMRKKVSTLKSKSKQQKTQNIKSYLLSKGFNLSAIDHELSKLIFDDEQETSNLLKDYEKLKNKYQHIESYEQKQEIIKRLYQKGYRIDDIKKVMD